jgi:hypothetical protein
VTEALEANDFPAANAERRAQLSKSSARFYTILTELAEQLQVKCSQEVNKKTLRRSRRILAFLEYARSDKSLTKMGEEQELSRARIGQLVAQGRQAALLYLKSAYNKKEEPFFSLLDECIALLSETAYDIVHLVEYDAISKNRKKRIELCHLLFGSALVQKIDSCVRR